MSTLRDLLLVALGGALGSMARYGLSLMASLLSVSGLWATLTANGLGSLLIGMSFALLKGDAYLLAAVGFCGGFTTFSTFSLQSVELLQSGQEGLAALYIVGSLALSMGCVVMGLYCAKSLVK
ncbi:MAG: CrcB family protein [Alistipes sp.]|nr:CrcB family protein [Alistipes sp.]